MLKLLSLSILGIALMACGGIEISEDRPTTGNLVFLGDSLTEGYQVEAAENFPSLIKNKLRAESFDNYEVINLGISGDRTADALKRLEAVLQAEPEIVVLALGGNDFLKSTSLLKVEENLKSIIEPLIAQDIEVVLIGVVAPPFKGFAYTRNVKAMYERVANEYNLAFLPNILKGLILDQRYMQPDNVHPTPAGYGLIADSVWEVLQPLLRP